MVSGMLASAALATFLPTAKFANMGFLTSDMSLLVDIDYFGPGDFRPEHNLPEAFGLHPGAELLTDDFTIKNASGQGQALLVSGKMTPGEGDWDLLKNVITLTIYSHTNGQSTPAYTLEEWTTEPRLLPKANINSNQIEGYQMRYQMLSTYATDPDNSGPLQAGDPIGNELMNKHTSHAVLVFTGETTEYR